MQKEIFLSVLFIISSSLAFCQTEPNKKHSKSQEHHSKIILKYENGKVQFEDHELELRKNNYYFLELQGINTAHHIFKAKSKSFEVYSPLPELLKPIFPGITGSLSASMKLDDATGNKITEWEKVNVNLDEIMRKFYEIRETADTIYQNTKVHPKKKMAENKLEIIRDLYGTTSNEKLSEKVRGDIWTVTAIAEVVKELISNQIEIDPAILGIYISSFSYAQEVENHNFLEYLNYIIRSTKAEKLFKTKSAFKAGKDLSEFRLILTDTYAQDTIYNEVEAIYNYGGIGLSFSSGFFYTENFSDESYYLDPRQDGRMAVKSENKTNSDISIGGLGHLYWKATSKLRIGPAIGLSISPFDEKFRYLAGVGCLFGKEKVIGLSAGVSWAKVKELSEIVAEDNEGLFLSSGATAIPTFDKIKQNFFIGLTYNIASTRK